MNLFDRNDPPARYAVKFYRDIVDDSAPPMEMLDCIELHTASNAQHATALARAHSVTNTWRGKHDSWEVVERKGLAWEEFHYGDGTGSWEFTDEVITDSWET